MIPVYRVSHVLVDLGWVDFDLGVPSMVPSREGPSGVRIDNHHSPGILLCGEPKVVSTVSMRLL